MLRLENLDGVGRDARGSRGRGRGHRGRSAPRTSGQFANPNLRYRAPKAGECRATYFATGCLSRERLTANYLAKRFITEVRGVARALDTLDQLLRPRTKICALAPSKL